MGSFPVSCSWDSTLPSPLPKLCISSCDAFEFLAFISICLTNVTFWCWARGRCGVYSHVLLCFFKHQTLAVSPLKCESSSQSGAFYSFEIQAAWVKRQKSKRDNEGVMRTVLFTQSVSSSLALGQTTRSSGSLSVKAAAWWCSSQWFMSGSDVSPIRAWLLKISSEFPPWLPPFCCVGYSDDPSGNLGPCELKVDPLNVCWEHRTPFHPSLLTQVTGLLSKKTTSLDQSLIHLFYWLRVQKIWATREGYPDEQRFFSSAHCISYNASRHKEDIHRVSDLLLRKAKSTLVWILYSPSDPIHRICLLRCLKGHHPSYIFSRYTYRNLVKHWWNINCPEKLPHKVCRKHK